MSFPALVGETTQQTEKYINTYFYTFCFLFDSFLVKSTVCSLSLDSTSSLLLLKLQI